MHKQNKFKTKEEWQKWNTENLNDEQMKNDIKKYKQQRANKYGNSKIDGKSKINYEKIISDIEKKYPNFSKKINSIDLQNQPSTNNTKSKLPQM